MTRNKDADKLKATIFNIQKYSIGDGPGIRTTVFFKGCPLRCPWCHNPESLYMGIEIAWHRKNCVKCLACINVCPKNAIKLVDDSIVTDKLVCNSCGKCVENCLFSAREILGETMTLQNVLNEVLEDQIFYEFSRGGVTCSGGEALMQADFVTALFKELKIKDIHTTLDTSGYGDWNEFKKILEYTDLVLYDLKHMNKERHLILTGGRLETILENFEKVAALQIPVIVRIPLIPGYNDDEENIEATAAYASKYSNVRKVELLPYHNFGEPKYAMLNKRYMPGHIDQISKERISMLKKIAAKFVFTE